MHEYTDSVTGKNRGWMLISKSPVRGGIASGGTGGTLLLRIARAQWRDLKETWGWIRRNCEAAVKQLRCATANDDAACGCTEMQLVERSLGNILGVRFPATSSCRLNVADEQLAGLTVVPQSLLEKWNWSCSLANLQADHQEALDALLAGVEETPLYAVVQQVRACNPLRHGTLPTGTAGAWQVSVPILRNKSAAAYACDVTKMIKPHTLACQSIIVSGWHSRVM